MQFHLDVTEEQARDLHAARHDPWQTIAIITAIAGPDFVARYVAQPLPRPVIQLRLPATLENVTFTIGLGNSHVDVKVDPFQWAPMIDAKIDFGLTSTATHQIPGRGTVKTCAPHELPQLGPITIDGEPMILTGIEGRAGWRPGDEIGLIVRQATLKQAADIAIKTSAEILASDIKTDVHGHVVEVPK